MPKHSPQAGLAEIDPTDVRIIARSINEMRLLGKCKTDQEVADRIDDYFRFCCETGNRPGIETMALALDIDRVTLFRWSQGQGCSQERAKIIQTARQAVTAYIEQAMLRGKLNPVSSIFTLKNWSGYRDQYSFEEIPRNQPHASMTPDEIQKEIMKNIPIDTVETETADIVDGGNN